MNPYDKHVNGMSHEQTERLTKLFEEASEVIQAAAKVFLHGYHDRSPKEGAVENKLKLEEEIGHFENALEMMYYAGDISRTSVFRAAERKAETVHRHLHYRHPSYKPEGRQK